MTTMNELIEEILAEYEPRFIFDKPIPEDEERHLPRPLRPQRPFTDLDDQVPPPVRLPADQWNEILNDAKDEFEVDGASAVFSTWRVEEDDPLDIGNIEIADGMHARAGRLALNARITDVRATQLLAALPEGNFILRLKFLRETDDDWVLEDKFDSVRIERKKGQRVIEISRDTKPGMLTGTDSVFYQIAYPVTAVAYGLYPIRDPDPRQPCSVERRQPQLRGTEGCGTLRGNPERPRAYTHTATENTGVGGGSSQKRCNR